MLPRLLSPELEKRLQHNSVVALLGPRQVGKTTLARQIASQHPSVYLDLESSADRFKLEEPILFLSQHEGKLVIIDEVHRKPELFSVLRILVDRARQAGKKKAQFLILGSASIELLKQSSESLAGRISYLELTGFHLLETNKKNLQKLWLSGGFPESYLASNIHLSFQWREDFIKTYLERDLPQFGFRIPSERLQRLWTMLAHLQGQALNASSLAQNLNVDYKTIQYYIDVLSDLLLVRSLKPWHFNTKKRLIKSPRIYIRDSGILHALLNIITQDNLFSHPVFGKSWEGFVIENILSILPKGVEAFFYRSSSGHEIDLLLKFYDQSLWAIEIKKGLSPKLSESFHKACQDVKATKKYVVYGGEETFSSKKETTFLSLDSIMEKLNSTVD